MNNDTEETLINQIVTNVDLRMDTLKKFYPFFKISQSRYKPEAFKALAGLDLGYIVLGLFEFFIQEGKLKNKGILYSEAKAFMKQLVEITYEMELTLDEVNRLTLDVFDKLRNEGMSYFDYPYYDPIGKRQSAKKVSYIKSEIKALDDKNYYYLTADGLEFFLRTKEFTDESKISIELILLRKMIQNNNFSAALDGVIRVNSYVSAHIARKYEILQQLVANGREGFESYKKYHAATQKCLSEEIDLFKETSEFVRITLKEYSNKIEKEQLMDKEKKAFETLKRIEVELKITLEKHMTLLREIADLIHAADELLEMSQASLFTEHFNFEYNLQKIIDQDDARLLHTVLSPLLTPKLPQLFNLESLDKMGTLRKPKEADQDMTINKEEAHLISEESRVKERVTFNFERLSRELLKQLLVTSRFNLEQFMTALKSEYGEESILNPDLFSFILSLSQHKGSQNEKVIYFDPTMPSDKLKGIEAILYGLIQSEEGLNALNHKLLSIEPLDEDVVLQDIFKVTNLQFELKAGV